MASKTDTQNYKLNHSMYVSRFHFSLHQGRYLSTMLAACSDLSLLGSE